MKILRWLTLSFNIVVLVWMLVAAYRDPSGPTSAEDKFLVLFLAAACVSSIIVMIDLLFIRRR